MIDKKIFYDKWKPKPVYSNEKRKYVIPKIMDTNFWMIVKDRIELHITWNADYKRNIYGIFSAQLLDQAKCGYKRQICNDLIINDLWERGLSSDYKLYKYIDNWVSLQLADYERRDRKGVFEV